MLFLASSTDQGLPRRGSHVFFILYIGRAGFEHDVEESAALQTSEETTVQRQANQVIYLPWADGTILNVQWGGTGEFEDFDPVLNMATGL